MGAKVKLRYVSFILAFVALSVIQAVPSYARSFINDPIINTEPQQTTTGKKSFVAKDSRVAPSRKADSLKIDDRSQDKIRYKHVYKILDPAEWEFFESLPAPERAEIAERIVRAEARTAAKKYDKKAVDRAYEYISKHYYTESGQEIIPIFGGKAVIPAKEAVIDAEPVTVNGQVIFPGKVRVQVRPSKVVDLKDFREIITPDKVEVGNPKEVVDGEQFDK